MTVKVKRREIELLRVGIGAELEGKNEGRKECIREKSWQLVRSPARPRFYWKASEK